MGAERRPRSGPQRRVVASLAATAGAAALTGLLLVLPGPGTCLHQLTRAADATSPDGPVLALVALVVQVLAGWLLLGVVVSTAAGLPGALGRGGSALAQRTVPAVVRRGVQVALGTGLALAPVAAPAAWAAPGQPGPPASSSLDWPVLLPASPQPSALITAAPAPWPTEALPTTAPAPTPPAAATPPASPVAVEGRPTSAGADPADAGPVDTPTAGRPTRPAPQPAPEPTRANRPTAAATAPAPVRSPVVVRRGDSLWSLAEQALQDRGALATPAAVAAAWPRWWSANREVVGDDPDLLLPGTALTPPL